METQKVADSNTVEVLEQGISTRVNEVVLISH
jgi:hypothetical protein